MSYEYTSGQQCSRSFCSAAEASKGDICVKDGSFNDIKYVVSDPTDCRLVISSGYISCTQECGGSSGGPIGSIVGTVVAVLSFIAFVAYCRGWCKKKDASTTEVEKEDVTGGDDLGDSPVETLRTVTVMPNGTKNITETIMHADGSRTGTQTVVRPEKAALPKPGRKTVTVTANGIKNADGSRIVTETVVRPEKAALPESGRNAAMAIDDGIYPDAF
jgi:hypothetical protein